MIEWLLALINKILGRNNSSMETNFYSVPVLGADVIDLGNQTILGVNDLIEDGKGLSGDEILAKAMAIRVRNSVACIIRLSNLGFIHESLILLRAAAEATILFHEAIEKSGFKDIYSLEESERVFQLLKKRKVIDDGKDLEKTKSLEKEFEEAKIKLNQSRDGRYKLGQLAEKNGCLHEYVHFYGLGSAYVHCLPNAMTTYFTVKPGKIIEWNDTPLLEDRTMVVSGALQCYGKIGIKWTEKRGDKESKDLALAMYENL